RSLIALAYQLRQPVYLIQLGDGRPEHYLVCACVFKRLDRRPHRLNGTGKATGDTLGVRPQEAIVVLQIDGSTLSSVLTQTKIRRPDKARFARPTRLRPGVERRRIARL